MTRAYRNVHTFPPGPLDRLASGGIAYDALLGLGFTTFTLDLYPGDLTRRER